MSDQYPPQGPGDGQQGGGQYGQPPQGGQYGQPQGGQQYGQPPQYAQPQYGAPVPTGPGGEPPLWAPWYGIPFGKAIARFWQKYATFSGRASRSEYWWWALVAYIVSFVLGIPAQVSSISAMSSYQSNPGGGVHFGGTYWTFVTISIIWGLATIIPSFALLFRRLHDTNRSGWWWFIAFIPFVGPIILLVFTILPSNPQGQRFDRPA